MTSTELPADVLARIRSICDDPLFCHRAAVAITRYRSEREELSQLPQTREQLKAPHKKLIESAQAYRVTARELGVPEDSHDMIAAAARIRVSQESLRDIDAIEGRLDKNWELHSLCRRLLELFDQHGVKKAELKTLLDYTVHDASTESIKNAVSSASKSKA